MEITGTQLWEMTLTDIKQQISKPSYETWFKSTLGLEIDENIFKVGVGNDFQRDWLETRYTSMLEEIISRIIGKKTFIKFIIKENIDVSDLFNNTVKKESLNAESDLAKPEIVQQLNELKQLSQLLEKKINVLELEVQNIK